MSIAMLKCRRKENWVKTKGEAAWKHTKPFCRKYGSEMKYIVIAAAERLMQNGKNISIWKNSGVIFPKKTGKIMYWIFAKHVMINGAAVLQAQNKILAGENPCFFFGEKENQMAFFAEKW